MATIDQISAKIQKNSSTKDAYIAKFRKEQAVLTAQLDVLVATEDTARVLDNMSDAQKQAIKVELGVS